MTDNHNHHFGAGDGIPVELRCCGMCPPNSGRTVEMWKMLKNWTKGDN